MTAKSESRNELPYFIEVDQNGCPHCGGDRTWGVVGPDCAALGHTWDNAQDAQDMADLLNKAFYEGRATVSETGERCRHGVWKADHCWECEERKS